MVLIFETKLILVNTIRNKIGKAHSLEYANIPKMLFTPRRVGHCCNNGMEGHWYLGHFYINKSQNHSWVTMSSNNDFRSFFVLWFKVPLLHNNGFQYWVNSLLNNNWSCWISLLLTMGPNNAVQSPIRCSSFTLGCEEHVIRRRVDSSGAGQVRLWAPVRLIKNILTP